MLVSAIMPTRGRPQFAREALACFDSQTYAEKELVIVDDADHPSFPDGLDRHNVQYHRLPKRLSVGAKRNICCSRAQGEIIWHLDDDDWSAPGRMADQVERLRESGLSVTGYRTMEFSDGAKRWLYNGAVNYALGTSLCYTREWWLQHPFDDIEIGEDGQFTTAALRHIVSVPAGNMMRATIHADNTSPRQTSKKAWSQL